MYLLYFFISIPTFSSSYLLFHYHCGIDLWWKWQTQFLDFLCHLHFLTPAYRSCHFYGLVQERRNSSAVAMESRLSCNNPSIYSHREDNFTSEMVNMNMLCLALGWLNFHCYIYLKVQCRNFMLNALWLCQLSSCNDKHFIYSQKPPPHIRSIAKLR